MSELQKLADAHETKQHFVGLAKDLMRQLAQRRDRTMPQRADEWAVIEAMIGYTWEAGYLYARKQETNQ